MEKLSQNEKAIWSCWETKTPREVVREAAAKGIYIKLAYNYLQYKNNWDLETAEEWFYAEVFSWVLQLLSRKQFFKASHVLNKVNVSPNKHMLTIAHESCDPTLRDYVTEQLIKTADDLVTDMPEKWRDYLDHWNLLRLLELSFDVNGVLKQNKAFGHGKDIIIVSLSDLKQYTIKKIEKLSLDWKKKIAGFLFIDNFDFSLENFLDPEYVWKILIQKNMAIILKHWISLIYSKENNIICDSLKNEKVLLKADAKILENDEILKKVDELFINWPITEEMIEYVISSDCFEFTKLYIMDTLSSFGRIADAEKNDIKILLRRLTRAQLLNNVDKIIAKNENLEMFFNDMVAQYCVRHNLYHAMTKCVHIPLNFNFNECVTTGTANCLEMWALFKHVIKSNNINDYVYLIHETSKIISNGDLDEYFSTNHELILAMLIFEEMNIFEIFNENLAIEIRNIVIKWNKDFNTTLPHLYSVYQRWKNDSLAIKNDVTIYQLLSGYKGLDVTKLFAYVLQQAKSNASSINTEYTNQSNYETEPPHFSNKQLVEKYGYLWKLNYLYYLKQNRPGSAAQCLMVEQFQKFNTISVKYLRNACAQAHLYALQNWNNNVITSVCISFISMIGCDSSRCRNHVTCANIIACYLEKYENKNKSDIIKVVTDLMNRLIKNDLSSVSEIFTLLVKSIEYILEEKRILKTNLEFSDILNEWQTVIKFAYFNHLKLPKEPLKKFALKNQWLSFLIFGDVFMYPHDDIISMCSFFENRILAEHITHAILHNETENSSEKRLKKLCEDDNQKIKTKLVDKNSQIVSYKSQLKFSSLTDDLWEIMSYCHGPEDPPGALIKASAYYHSPILALLATCYEPDAVDVCWAQWMITNMKKNEFEILLSSDIRDAADMILSDSQMIKIMKISLEHGYYKTLHESFLVFYQESPLCTLLQFLVKTAIDFDFNDDSIHILKSFKNLSERRPSIMDAGDRNSSSHFMKASFIQLVAIELLTVTLCKSFKSTWHQKEFLRCICESNVTKKFNVPTPDFCKLVSYINISMKCGINLSMEEICTENCVESEKKFLTILIQEKYFDEAFNFANIAKLNKDDLLIAEWTEKYQKLMDGKSEFDCNEVVLLQFWAKCSFTLKKHNVGLKNATTFLKNICDATVSKNIKFYLLRIILGWFEDFKDQAFESHNLNHYRDLLEFEMWNEYLSTDDTEALQILSTDDTYEYIFNLSTQTKIISQDSSSVVATNKLFNMSLDDIISEANLSNMTITEKSLLVNHVDKWNTCILKLLDAGLVIEAWRLDRLFKIPVDYISNVFNYINIVETCLKLATGIISPNEIPDNVRIVFTSSPNRLKTLDSQLSDSFEELVLIPEKQETFSKDNASLAGKKDADILSILETLSLRTNCKLVKLISNYFRISLQIGWSYEKVLKFQGNPLELIHCLSGRSRMPLAKNVFHTYEITSSKVMEFLSLEIITAIISSHLTRTFKQKEHFKYTLWGYFLDTDFEMFLNMRPNGNSILGKLILEYLSAFRKLYKKITGPFKSDPEDPPNQNTSIESDVESENSENALGGILPLFRGFSNNSDNQSIISYATQNFIQRRRKEKRPQLDVISCTNIHISSFVKSNMKMLVKNSKLTSKQINIISIELLIVAHECFSSVCDTEGIATILRTAQTMTSHLLAAHSWRLMVRLLTGIARYTEMAYIFQILRDNEQFEFLLGQFNYMMGQHDDKINNFKFGLLEFLKRHCPGDTELYCLVALHFSMFPEAAEVKKKQANDLIVAVKQMALDSMKILKKKPVSEPEWIILADNDSSRLLLETALNHCSDGAELYTKGGCLVTAREMAALAQLIALQISLLKKPPTKCLFNLKQDKMSSLIESYLSFMEGFVFSQAIDVTHGGWLSQWRDIIYQRVLKKDDIFIKDISTYRPDIAFYIVERYDQTKNSLLPDEPPIITLRSLFK